ncbi:hypothetical protein APHAL10511_003631 [Amanita phalloides]|nr:hypothetical protein APHAL10511_003631 [Amanita phalloides]
MQQNRYDNNGATYGPPISLPPGGMYNISIQHRMYEPQQSSGQYCDQIHSGMNTTEAQQNDRYQNTSLPATQPVIRYPEHQSSTRVYPHQGPPRSSSVPYGPHSSSVDQHNQRTPSTQFILTPSEMVRYGGSQTHGHPQEQYVASPSYESSSVLQPPRIPPSGPRTVPGGSPTAASGERFLCEKCGKTFSRSHDRKRHHETQHLPTPVIHRCRFCEKEFSRSDSLKRHRRIPYFLSQVHLTVS